MSTPAATAAVDRATFGPLLRAVLSSGGALAAICVAILLSGLLPPRSAWLTYLATALVAIGLVELVAVTMALVRLIRSADNRSASNIAATCLGTVGVMPFLVIYLRLMVDG